MSLGGDMGTITDLVLLIVREHPDGISTMELAEYVPGPCLDVRRSKAYDACRRLEKFDFVRAERIPYRKPGSHANKAVIWRPVE